MAARLTADPGRSGATSEWRNWQTRQPKELVSERTWGFKSPLRHEQMFDHSQISDRFSPDFGRSQGSSPSASTKYDKELDKITYPDAGQST